MTLKQQKLASQINPKYVIGDWMVYKNLYPELFLKIKTLVFIVITYNDSK